MHTKKPPAIKFIGMLYPRIESLFFLDLSTDKTFSISYKIDVQIITDTELHVVFGIQLLNAEDVKNASVQVRIDALGFFELVEAPIPKKINKLNDVPLIANVLAILFPYIREKISSCLIANKIHYYMQATNTFDLVTNAKAKSFQIQDDRTEKKKASRKTSK